MIFAPYGRIVVVGNRGSIELDPILAMIKEADMLGMAIFNVHPDEYKESLYAVSGFLQSGILHPEVGEVYPFEYATKAHGKMILTIY